MNQLRRLIINTEFLGLLCICAIFAVVAILGAGRFHPVWLDEVALAEPAANLYFNGQFSSNAWYHQASDSLHVGTSLLYTFLLSVWMKLVGFDVIRVRLFNYFLIAVAAVILSSAVKRLQLVIQPYLLLLLVLSFLTIGGINFIYISGRYDVICLFLSVLIIYSFSFKKTNLRLTSILLIGFLFPISGISALAFALLISIG